jgi:hypothetical protein
VHQIWINLRKGSRSLQGRQTMNFVDRAYENCGRLEHDPEKVDTGFPSGQTRSVCPEIMLTQKDNVRV